MYVDCKYFCLLIVMNNKKYPHRCARWGYRGLSGALRVLAGREDGGAHATDMETIRERVAVGALGLAREEETQEANGHLEIDLALFHALHQAIERHAAHRHVLVAGRLARAIAGGAHRTIREEGADLFDASGGREVMKVRRKDARERVQVRFALVGRDVADVCHGYFFGDGAVDAEFGFCHVGFHERLEDIILLHFCWEFDGVGCCDGAEFGNGFV